MVRDENNDSSKLLAKSLINHPLHIVNTEPKQLGEDIIPFKDDEKPKRELKFNEDPLVDIDQVVDFQTIDLYKNDFFSDLPLLEKRILNIPKIIGLRIAA